MSQLGNNIVYHPAVVKIDIPKLGKREAVQVKRAIETKLKVDPLLFGVPLRGTLKHYWKLRVGNWRIVYTIERKVAHVQVSILIIAHRSEVYKLADKRT